jgi:carbamoylphosphate synthase large subunit
MRVLALEDNPATLIDLGGGTGDLFMEPPAAEVVERIVEGSGVRSMWYGLGGKRGWTLAVRLAREPWYEASGMHAPDLDDRTLWLCGDRSLLRETLEASGIANPAFRAVGSAREGQEVAEKLGFPLVVRPHFSCGGWGAGLAYNLEDYPELLEEAMRESLTGEVLVEEALHGWRKYIVLVLRDRDGGICIPGLLEQEEPLPKHDEDAVLVYPPQRAGREGEYALREMARNVVEALDLLGLIEIKLAAAPGWESLYVIDINPRPWRAMPLLEAARGVDLLRAHLDLLMGRSLSAGYAELDAKPPDCTTVIASCPAYRTEREGEGYLALGCRSMGRRLFRGGDAREAAAAAVTSLSRGPYSEVEGETLKALRGLMRPAKGKVRAGGGTPGMAGQDAEPSYYRSWPVSAGVAGGVMVLAGDNGGPGGGYEANVNCFQAVQAWKSKGGRVAVYTPDPGYALLASRVADAVFLGSLETAVVAHAVSVLDAECLTAHFGGRAAMDIAADMADRGMVVWGMQALQGGGRLTSALRRAGESGIKVVDFKMSKGREEGEGVLEGASYPLLATEEGAGKRPVHRLVYTPEEGREMLRGHQGDILWRPLKEEAQEVQVEAVATNGGHVVLLWEQVDAAGMYSTDGLAVFPPCYLTSEQSRKALELAREAIDALGWRGNLSMRIHIHNGDIGIWSLSPGPSASLPFLYRASSLPLAAYGMLTLGGGRDIEMQAACEPCSAVRAPLIPFGMIAGADILPSPQRRSSGAVIGMANDPGMAFAKALWSQGLRPQPGGVAFLSVANRDKRRALLLARELQEAGYILKATRGTAHALAAAGIEAEAVNKLREGRPNILDLIRNGQVGLVVNIPRGKYPHSDGFYIRAASVRHGIPCVTNMEVALTLARAMRQADPPAWEIMPLEGYCRVRREIRG